jgi:drug/metabolite transporter (DMT)-like permease
MLLTSSSYIMTAVLGAVALGETVSTADWLGIALIFLGVAIVGRTAPRTADLQAELAR